MEAPNQLIVAEAAELGAADTTPDNLYMMGTFRLAPDEALLIDIEPPESRYWSVTLENIWHECIDPRRRQSHITNASVVTGTDGTRADRGRGGRPGRGQLARHRWPSPGLRGRPLARQSRGSSRLLPCPTHRPAAGLMATGRFEPDRLVEEAVARTGRGRLRRTELAGGSGHPPRLVGARGPAQRASAWRSPPRKWSPTWPIASPSPRGGTPTRRWPEAPSTAHLHRRATADRHDHPLRPVGPGSDPAGPADLGGRPAGTGTGDGHLPLRPPHRGGAGDPRPGRVGHARLHVLPPRRGPAGPGVRPDDGGRFPQHDLPHPVPDPDLRSLAPPRRRPGPRLPVASSLSPTSPIASPGRPVAAQIAGPPLASGCAGRRVPRRRHRAHPSGPAEGDRVRLRPHRPPAGHGQ